MFEKLMQRFTEKTSVKFDIRGSMPPYEMAGMLDSYFTYCAKRDNLQNIVQYSLDDDILYKAMNNCIDTGDFYGGVVILCFLVAPDKDRDDAIEMYNDGSVDPRFL